MTWGACSNRRSRRPPAGIRWKQVELAAEVFLLRLLCRVTCLDTIWWFWKPRIQPSLFKNYAQKKLVGGFNPFEKYESKWESSPKFRVDIYINNWKPPPRKSSILSGTPESQEQASWHPAAVAKPWTSKCGSSKGSLPHEETNMLTYPTLETEKSSY